MASFPDKLAPFLEGSSFFGLSADNRVWQRAPVLPPTWDQATAGSRTDRIAQGSERQRTDEGPLPGVLQGTISQLKSQFRYIVPHVVQCHPFPRADKDLLAAGRPAP